MTPRAPTRLRKLHLNLAGILAKTRQTNEAVEAAREALSYFDRKGVVPAIARTEALLAELGQRVTQVDVDLAPNDCRLPRARLGPSRHS